MHGVLLDTHALYWLATGSERLSDEALSAIGVSQAAGQLLVSPISAWELSIAAWKPARSDPPRFGLSVSAWFRAAIQTTSAKVVLIGQRIAIEAANVPAATGHKDPGDCYLMATSRVRKVPLITRDAVILDLDQDGYLGVIAC